MKRNLKATNALTRVLSVLLVIAVCSTFASTSFLSLSKYAFNLSSDISFSASATFSLAEIDDISGSPNVAETLTAGDITPSSAASYITYQWQKCLDENGDYDDITGATGNTYLLAADDQGYFIKVTATGFDKFTSEVTSAAFGPILAPLVTELTAIGDISGSALFGQTLSAGAVTPSGATVTYRWLESSSLSGTYTPISNATSYSYTTVATDINCYLKVEASGYGDYSGTVTSAAFGTISGYSLTAISDIIGTATIGSVLTAGYVTPASATFTYQWQTIDGAGTISNISSATASTFTLTSGQTGCFVRVLVIGTGSYLGSTVISAATATKVGSASTPITNMAAISGTLNVGQTLTAGVITPVGATVTYQWWKCLTSGGAYSKIDGATGSTYTLQSSDYGYYIRVIATGAGSYSSSKTATSTAAVGKGTITAISDISGACASGQTLTAGTVTPTGATVSYQWLKSSSAYGTYANISGATLAALALASSDVGYFFKVIATGTGNFTGSATSAFAGAVFNGSTLQLTSIGAVGGSPQIGAVLAAGDLNPIDATANYQWQKASSAGGTYSDISGAASDSYTATMSDAGYYIRVKATGSGHYTGTVTSTPTGPISAQSITAISDIVGTGYAGKILRAGTITPLGATVTYQWQRVTSGGTIIDIPGATASTYTVLTDDYGCYLRVSVTGTGAYTGSVISEPTPNKISSTFTTIALSTFGNIGGTLKIGETLFAGALTPVGAVATYQWQKCTSSGGSFADIPGATDYSYKLSSADLGYYLRVIATGAGLYTGTLSKTTTAAVTTQASLTAIDSISGTAAAGNTLTAGPITPSGATVSYQWSKASSAYGTYSTISGATFSTLLLTADDVNSYFKVTATGTGGYTGSVTSMFIGPVISTAAIPITSIAAIGGSAQIGALLTAGDITPAAATATYQWQRGVMASGTYSDISGATSGNYTVTAADCGCYIRVRAIGSGSYTGTVTSAPLGTVSAQPLTAISSVIGSASKGNTLTAGTVTPLGATVTYQWQTIDGNGTVADITGATSNSLLVLSDYNNCYLRVKATGTGAYSGTVISMPTPKRASDTASTALGGTASIMCYLSPLVSDTLTAVTTAVTPSGATVTYQWQRCSTSTGTYGDIVGATGRTYTTTASDVTYYIKVIVKGSGIYSGTITSAAKGPIAVKPITAIGTIGGTTISGQTLTAGSLTPVGATATYQWLYCTTYNGTYNNISGATQSTYILGTGDVNHFIKVTATGTGAYSGSVTSVYAGSVTSGTATAVTAIGSVSGTAQVGQLLTAGAVTPVGATVTYQWQRGVSASGTFSNIAGATLGTYTLTANDFGCFIRVKAIGSGTYTGSAVSAPTGSTVAACPLSAISNIIGSTSIGSTLTAGTVTPLRATVTYQWQSSSDGTTFTNLAGCTAETYVITSSDSNNYFRILVTGTGAYTGSAASAKTTARASGATLTAVTAIGAISSTSAKVGVTQTAGSLTPSGATVTYQWTRSTSTTASTYVNIQGATSSTYVPTTDDVGYYLRVTVTGSGLYSGTVTSNYKGTVSS